MQPIKLTSVTLGGEFGRRVDAIIEANILKIDPEETFLKDFRQRGKGGYTGLGKFIGAVVRLSALGDPRLVALKKKVIAALLSTQDPDGYIGFVADPKLRMKILWDLHENAYVIWALVSDYEFFKEVDSLKAAQAMADYVLARLTANPALLSDNLDESLPLPFSIASIGFDQALLALSRATGNTKYRDFAVDALKLNEYCPDICPGVHPGEGHSYSYMAHCLAQLDLYGHTRDPQLLRAAQQALDFLRQGDGLLVTGSCTDWEYWHDTQSGLQFTSETCAAAHIGWLMDALLQLEGQSLYGDIMERDIYNALFAATAPDGSRSRYFTPFDGKRYYDWNGARFCCANNNKRFLADLRGWLYYRTASGVAVNLYHASSATIDIASDVTLKIEQQTDYPTSGNVLLKIDPSKQARFEVKLRIPRWCKAATVSVDGEASQVVSGGQFYTIERIWKPGDEIELKMPMQWRFVRGRRSQSGRAAVLRGPVIFTLNPARNATLTEQPGFEPRFLLIDPQTVELPARDDTVRPGGVSCTLTAKLPGGNSSLVKPLPLVLTEYPDPEGQAIYFLVHHVPASLLTDDELICPGVIASPATPA